MNGLSCNEHMQRFYAICDNNSLTLSRKGFLLIIFILVLIDTEWMYFHLENLFWIDYTSLTLTDSLIENCKLCVGRLSKSRSRIVDSIENNGL